MGPIPTIYSIYIERESLSTLYARLSADKLQWISVGDGVHALSSTAAQGGQSTTSDHANGSTITGWDTTMDTIVQALRDASHQVTQQGRSGGCRVASEGGVRFIIHAPTSDCRAAASSYAILESGSPVEHLHDGQRLVLRWQCGAGRG